VCSRYFHINWFRSKEVDNSKALTISKMKTIINGWIVCVMMFELLIVIDVVTSNAAVSLNYNALNEIF